MWGYLEAFIEDLLVLCLISDPTFLDNERVRKLTIKLADYEQMTPIERKQHILKQLQQDGQENLSKVSVNTNRSSIFSN